MNFIDMIPIKKYDVISLSGSGGKTILLRKICHELVKRLLDREKILMTTTTKICIPPFFTEDEIYFPSFQEINLEDPHPIHIFGHCDDGKKVHGMMPSEFKDISPYYTYIINEADGSKGYPFKAWREFEPVIPQNTTVTIGILPYLEWNEDVTEKNVFEKELFIKYFSPEKKIDFYTLEHIINSPKGLFKNSLGDQILYINHVENKKQKKEVENFINLTQFKGKKIIIGSTVKEEYYEYCRNCNGQWIFKENGKK